MVKLRRLQFLVAKYNTLGVVGPEQDLIFDCIINKNTIQINVCKKGLTFLSEAARKSCFN